VPDSPAVTASNILYYWIGLQDRQSPDNPVIQPVLSFVPGSSADNWYFESWNCCPAGHKIKSTSVAVTGPGERLLAKMSRDPSGLYTINSTNAQGQSSILISDDTNSAIVRTWDWADIVLETYAISDCQQYSSGGEMAFEGMQLLDASGDPISSTWTYSPYINGKYLPPAEAAAFAACCDGRFSVAWPDAIMEQNGDRSRARETAKAVVAEAE